MFFSSEHAEADTFFCFTNLMGEIRDFFIKTLDEAEFGINSMMSKLINQVKTNDPEVWMRLHQQELCPQYYSFRYCVSMIIVVKGCVRFRRFPAETSLICPGNYLISDANRTTLSAMKRPM